MTTIKLPDGQKVVLENIVSYSDDGISMLAFNSVGGNINPYIAPDLATLNYVVAQVDQVFARTGGSLVEITLPVSATISLIEWSTDGGANWNTGNAPASTAYQLRITGTILAASYVVTVGISPGAPVISVTSTQIITNTYSGTSAGSYDVAIDDVGGNLIVKSVNGITFA